MKADTAQLGRGGANGILGIGPSSISAINKKYSSSKGEPFLSRIFKQNATLENYFTIFLSRSPDVEPPMAEAEVGQFTLGEVIPRFEDIVNTSKLPVINDQYHSQRWEILLDANGVIGPDGEKINTTTRIKNPQSGAQTQLRVAFDSGFTMPQVCERLSFYNFWIYIQFMHSYPEMLWMPYMVEYPAPYFIKMVLASD